jgi:DNA polymerase-3 subunit beta
MQITCSFRQLKGMIQSAAKITGKNTLLPVASAICFETKDDLLIVSTTNVNLSVKIQAKVTVKKQGRIVVPVSYLVSFLSSINPPEDTVITLSGAGSTLDLIGSTFKTSIKVLPEEDFPSISKTEGYSFSCLNTEFTSALRSVYFSAAQSDIKPEISSVFVTYQEDTLVFVATDSFRLSEKRVYIPDLYGFPSILIPLKNVVDIIKILESTIGSLKITINQNQLSIEVGNIYINSHILNAAFPDYTKIIPQKTETSIKVLTKDFLDLCKAATVFSNKDRELVLSLDTKKNTIHIETTTPDSGSFTGDVSCKAAGNSFTVSINHEYLMNFFSVAGTDSLEILWFGESKPLILKPLGDDTYLYLVMPMRKS